MILIIYFFFVVTDKLYDLKCLPTGSETLLYFDFYSSFLVWLLVTFRADRADADNTKRIAVLSWRVWKAQQIIIYSNFPEWRVKKVYGIVCWLAARVLFHLCESAALILTLAQENSLHRSDI